MLTPILWFIGCILRFPTTPGGQDVVAAQGLTLLLGSFFASCANLEERFSSARLVPKSRVPGPVQPLPSRDMHVRTAAQAAIWCSQQAAAIADGPQRSFFGWQWSPSGNG